MQLLSTLQHRWREEARLIALPVLASGQLRRVTSGALLSHAPELQRGRCRL
jgi:hypothetical protein